MSIEAKIWKHDEGSCKPQPKPMEGNNDEDNKHQGESTSYDPRESIAVKNFVLEIKFRSETFCFKVHRRSARPWAAVTTEKSFCSRLGGRNCTKYREEKMDLQKYLYPVLFLFVNKEYRTFFILVPNRLYPNVLLKTIVYLPGLVESVKERINIDNALCWKEYYHPMTRETGCTGGNHKHLKKIGLCMVRSY